MIIINTTDGVRFVNEAEVIQVYYSKDKAKAEVWPCRWYDRHLQFQSFVIENVESVTYTTAQDKECVCGSSELEKQKKIYDDLLNEHHTLRQETLNLMQENDNLRAEIKKMQPKAAPYENDLLRDTVFPEIERLEKEYQNERNKNITNTRWRYIKKGTAMRFMTIARQNDVETVGQLLAVGSVKFLQFHNMGKNCLNRVSQALENLYDIKKW